MQKTESGSAASALVTIILGVVALGALIFGLWAFQSRQDYKNNTDQKVGAAVSAAETTQKNQLEAQFAEAAKQPYKTFTGSSTYGSITFNYPNTWSSYVDETSQNEPINGYYSPGDVPGVSSNSAFALRVELTNNSYNNVLQQYSQQVTQGTLTDVAYLPPSLKGNPNAQVGSLLTGAVGQSGQTPLNGAMLIIPVRNTTLQIYTLSNDYLSDFNNVVLTSLKFTP